MKKFLQACELGGSIYGKDKRSSRAKKMKKTPGKEDLRSSCKNFYKDQVDMFTRVFGQHR